MSRARFPCPKCFQLIRSVQTREFLSRPSNAHFAGTQATQYATRQDVERHIAGHPISYASITLLETLARATANVLVDNGGPTGPPLATGYIDAASAEKWLDVHESSAQSSGASTTTHALWWRERRFD